MRSDVALKIMTDKATQAPELRELEFIQHSRRQNPGHVGYPHVVHLTDSFYIDGPHGKTPMHRDRNGAITRCKRVIRDVLSAPDYVHSVCNIIHMGRPCVLHSRVLSNIYIDVKITNVMMTALHEEMPQEGLGVLIPAQLHTFPASADKDTPAWLSFNFKLIVFGVVCYADKTDEHFTQEVCPVGVRPPEVTLRAGWGKPLQALGEFPASLRNRSRISKAWFNDDGSLRHKDVFPKKSLEALVEEQSGGALTLWSDCLHFMRRMLTLESDERASIEELLRHRWLN
ncbi:uncharacterized protein ARMOST_18077 [Armillaria ostoyae]|uniref:non-specific serine/threonine protein kinase n=1 Tax=Armillaria ostoyae TaxID=47428 RepID=A0A284S0T2_ARMOS|nr:uncharacterized protein ARMOST_18077 [Armillaria ostoyae]